MSTTTTTHLQPTRLRPRDILSQGLVGLRAKRLVAVRKALES